LQITKHVAKINGERTFIGLFTFTNGKGEIQGANWVSTKAHSQFELRLASTRHSLNLFNHRQPEAAYNDNLADKPFLESIFPSLCAGVVPVEDHAHLKPLLLPSDVKICVRQGSQCN
jgi:hypothetical protein